MYGSQQRPTLTIYTSPHPSATTYCRIACSSTPHRGPESTNKINSLSRIDAVHHTGPTVVFDSRILLASVLHGWLSAFPSAMPMLGLIKVYIPRKALYSTSLPRAQRSSPNTTHLYGFDSQHNLLVCRRRMVSTVTGK
jgi:hypothetical protein